MKGSMLVAGDNLFLPHVLRLGFVHSASTHPKKAKVARANLTNFRCQATSATTDKRASQHNYSDGGEAHFDIGRRVSIAR